MIKGTNNQIIYINAKAVLESEDKSIVFDDLQLLAQERVVAEGSGCELQKAYMKLLSNKK